MQFRGKSYEAVLNRAYGGFLLLGLITLPLGLAALLSEFHLMNFDEGSGGLGETLSGLAYFVGILFGLPIFVGMIVATGNGIWQAARFLHPALVVLSAISIVCGGGIMIYIPTSDVPGHPYLEYACDIGGGLYVASNVLIPAWWFALGLPRYRDTALRHE